MFIKRSALHALGHLFSNGYPADIIEETPRDQSLIHISELTGCALKLWLNLKEHAPVSAYTSMPMAIGKTLHELTQSILKAIDPEIGVEVPVSYLPAYPYR